MKHYSKKFKDEALKLSDEICVKKQLHSSELNITQSPIGVNAEKPIERMFIQLVRQNSKSKFVNLSERTMSFDRQMRY